MAAGLNVGNFFGSHCDYGLRTSDTQKLEFWTYLTGLIQATGTKCPYQWNDHPHRTQDEVIFIIKQAEHHMGWQK